MEENHVKEREVGMDHELNSMVHSDLAHNKGYPKLFELSEVSEGGS